MTAMTMVRELANYSASGAELSQLASFPRLLWPGARGVSGEPAARAALGVPLAEALDARPGLSICQAVRIARDVAAALTAAHLHDRAIGEVSARTVIVDDERAQAYLVAPSPLEELRPATEASRRDELAGLGGLLFRLLTARPPCPERDLVRVRLGFPVASLYNARVPAGVEEILGRLIGDAQGRGYPSSKCAFDDLRRALDDLEASGTAGGGAAPAAPARASATPSAPRERRTPSPAREAEAGVVAISRRRAGAEPDTLWDWLVPPLAGLVAILALALTGLRAGAPVEAAGPSSEARAVVQRPPDAAARSIPPRDHAGSRADATRARVLERLKSPPVSRTRPVSHRSGAS